jgi:1-acyl-sn-glycerol-3-phosphate acyltransferase
MKTCTRKNIVLLSWLVGLGSDWHASVCNSWQAEAFTLKHPSLTRPTRYISRSGRDNRHLPLSSLQAAKNKTQDTLDDGTTRASTQTQSLSTRNAQPSSQLLTAIHSSLQKVNSLKEYESNDSANVTTASVQHKAASIADNDSVETYKKVNGDTHDAKSSAMSNKEVSESVSTLSASTTTPSPNSYTQQLATNPTTTAISPTRSFSPIQSFFTRIGLQVFIVLMCICLPTILLPQIALSRMGILKGKRQHILALHSCSAVTRVLWRLVGFARLQVIRPKNYSSDACIWVCNHTSMLDVFCFLAADSRMRGPHRLPIKVLYWKQLESNLVCRLLFKQAGFIPVQMEDNGHGTPNQYDKRSFKQVLKECKKALQDGYDFGILPEGQLNPDTRQGLLPIFPGAFHLAQIAKCPIRIWALHGADQVWHPTRGMVADGRLIKIRRFEGDWRFESANDFVQVFERVVGHFGKTGKDLPADEMQELQAKYMK